MGGLVVQEVALLLPHSFRVTVCVEDHVFSLCPCAFPPPDCLENLTVGTLNWS